MTADAYLTWEREQSERHEYVHGEVFAMSGGSPRHAALVAAMTIELGVAHRDGPCRVLSTDQRIVAEKAEHYVYPCIASTAISTAVIRHIVSAVMTVRAQRASLE